MKKVYLLAIILIACFAVNLQAQDTLMFKNGDVKITKIIQIKSAELTYKDFANLEGPDYVIELSKIKSIHFQNGTVQEYNMPDNENIEYVNDVPTKKKEDTILAENPLLPLRNFENYDEKYEYYKNMAYNYQPGDKMNPWVSSLASYFIPGLGQIISGETGRGLAFMGGTYGCYIVAMVGFVGTSASYAYDISDINQTRTNNSNRSMYQGLAIGGAVAAAGVYIWNIIDAYTVAKINNLYARDLQKRNRMSFHIAPYIDANNYAYTNSKQLPMGLSLKVSF